MNENNDDVLVRLRDLDPVRNDPAPEPGSARFEAIRQDAIDSAGDSQPVRRQSSPVLATAVVVAGVLALSTVLRLGLLMPPPSAEAEMRSSAEGFAKTTAVRMIYKSTLPNQDLDDDGEISIDLDGDRYRILTDSNGETAEIIGINRTTWVVVEDQVISKRSGRSNLAEDLSPSEGFVGLVDAALQSSQIVDEGPAMVNGHEVRRFRIDIDHRSREALTTLPPTVLTMFGFDAAEGPQTSSFDDVNSFTVWAADGLVHKVVVASDAGKNIVTFSDFDADLAIEAPA